ncbi:hypothetical protein [Asticcacaulis sp. AC402]|uniref:hypothetical protein n=1 Tax=Asticcacaulis sp. AC402 TaxID=1282361 RepID=UPI0003C3CA23|nr:hypothetical protein [Asticcacaulis sp. AC402]ESQ74847.1 hypothetical protein ABAC402_11890 [Asticcacaulis sp. AC402]
MRGWLLAGWLFVAAGPAMSAETTKSDKVVAEIAPLIEHALTQPMVDIYAAAKAGEANDLLVMGLAQVAGRVTDGEFTEVDRKAIDRLDARVVSPFDSYVEQHPDRDIARVNWRRKFKLTKDELALVHRYEMAYLPDFWLAAAATRTRRMRVNRFVRPTSAMITSGVYAGGDSLMGLQGVPFIPLDLLFTAAHCVAAVRDAAGLELQPLDLHPLSVRLFRSFRDFDIIAELETQAAGFKRRGPVGAAACGSPDQFNGYVAKLRASTTS